MKIIALVRSPYASLIYNIVYALTNCVVGLANKSRWFTLIGAYYAILAITRYSVLQIQKRAKHNLDTELFSKKITGFLFIVLSFCLIGINILSAHKDRGTVFHKIIMITIATYTFSKITFAVIGIVKAKKVSSPIIKTLRNISFADAFVSIYAMQRSMLVSFPGMELNTIRLFNILLGTAVWLIILLLGINLIGGRCVELAKSKLVQANDKITKAVTKGYKKIEKGVVDGYTKIEDKFIDMYLAKDGESLEEAKKGLKKQ